MSRVSLSSSNGWTRTKSFELCALCGKDDYCLQCLDCTRWVCSGCFGHWLQGAYVIPHKCCVRYVLDDLADAEMTITSPEGEDRVIEWSSRTVDE